MAFHMNLLVLLVSSCLNRYRMAVADAISESNSTDALISLDSARKSLIRQEDNIIFGLIERANFPMNSLLYDQTSGLVPAGFSGSLFQFFVRENEAIQAKAGKYENPEEHPFFPENLPPPLVSHKFPRSLYPAASSVNVNTEIWDLYLSQLLPSFVADSDDGNYASTGSNVLNLLQALSRRIHFGKFVAEAKFKAAPQDYAPLIHAKDRDALMKLLTDEKVEEMVKKRVEKKAMIFGKEVTLNETDNRGTYKVDPSLAARLYEDWVMPLTKKVEVEYLLRRLD